MSVNSNLSIPETLLSSAVTLACQGNPQGAAQLMQPFVNEEQKTTIAALIQDASECPNDAPSLQNRISAVLSVLPTPQIPQIPKSPREASPTTTTTKMRAVSTQHLCFSIDKDVWVGHIMTQLDHKSCSQLSSVCKRFNQAVLMYLEQILVGIPILDTGSGDLPLINRWKVMQWSNELGPLVEGNADCSVVIMRKDLTLRKQKEQAQKLGVDIACYSQILQQLGDVPVNETYAVFITNAPIGKIRNKTFNEQKEQVTALGCELPTVQEYLALCTLSQSIFKKCLYGKKPLTYGLTSTIVERQHVAIGDSSMGFIYISPTSPGHLDRSDVVAGVKRRLD